MKITKKTVKYTATGNISVRVDVLASKIKYVPPLEALFKFLGGEEVRITRATVHDPKASAPYRWFGDHRSTIATGGAKFYQFWHNPPTTLRGTMSYTLRRRSPYATYTVYPVTTINVYRGYIMSIAASGVQRTRGDYPYEKGGDTVAIVEKVKPSSNSDGVPVPEYHYITTSAPEFSRDGMKVHVDYLPAGGWVDPLIPASYSTGYVDPQKDVELFIEFCIPNGGGTQVLVPAVFVIRRSNLPSVFSAWRGPWTNLAITATEAIDFLIRLIAISNADKRTLSKYIPYIKLPGILVWNTAAPMFELSTFIQGSEEGVYIGAELPPSGELYVYEHHTDIHTNYTLYEGATHEKWVDTVLRLACDVTPQEYMFGAEVNTETTNGVTRTITFKRPAVPVQTCCIANLGQSNATGVTGYFCATPETVTNLSYVLDPGTMSRLTNMLESM